MTGDKLLIQDLLLRGIVGLNDWEREKKQDILINMTMFADISAAAESDNIEDATNVITVGISCQMRKPHMMLIGSDTYSNGAITEACATL